MKNSHDWIVYYPDLILILFIRLYKKLDLDGNVWSIFVHKTEDFEVDTLIECGASCNSKEQQCDMFIFQKEKLKCHVGTFENSNQNYLNGQTGTNPAFLYIGKYIFYPLFVLSNILELALNYYLDLNIIYFHPAL